MNENLVKTSSAREALQFLLKNDVAVILIDVCMPELDGFQLAAMLREHPRFSETAIIFISAIHLTDVDRLRGYAMGAVDYVPVPVIPDVLRAKVKVFVELYRKTRELEQLNLKLERHVAERTAELEASNMRLAAKRAGPQPGAGGRPDGLVGMGHRGQSRLVGRGPVPHLRRRAAKTFRSRRTISASSCIPTTGSRCGRWSLRMAKGERTQQVEFRVRRPNGELRWCTGTAAASVDAAGNVVRISGVTIDVTERKEAEERQVLLAREVDHRARNALAIIQSIIRLTRAKSVDDYVATVEGRIKALALAHTLLSDSRWHGADLGTLVAEEFAPYRSGNKIELKGPNVSLSPATAQGIALALHELATNAAKHGALSSIKGKISLTWQLQPDILTLNWVESGGPPIKTPSARSFGLKVIKASIEQQLGGKAVFDWNPKGLRCDLSIALRETRETRQHDGAHQTNGGNGAAIELKKIDKSRVLVVEDEALVGIMIQECLTELGFQIVGPVCTASDALAAAKSGDFDAAILDINLGDGMVYQVAEILARRHVPFVFVTGYDAESVDSRFREIPVLQKPVEREMLQKLFAQGADRSMAGLARDDDRVRA